MSKRKFLGSNIISNHTSNIVAGSLLAQNCSDIPEELLEIVFRHFFLTTKTDLKNRAALLRTCSKWKRIGEPILWRHIAIVEDSCHIPRSILLSLMLSRQPTLGEQIESFSLDVHNCVRLYQSLHQLRLTVPTKFMTNLKSVSLHIELSGDERPRGNEYYFFTRVLYNCPRSCQSFHVRVGSVDKHSNYEGFTPILRVCVYDVCRLARFVRLELPAHLASAVFTDRNYDQYVNLESIVLIVTAIDTSRKRGYMVRPDSEDTLELLLNAAAAGNLPKLKKALLMEPRPRHEFGDLMLSYKGLTRVGHNLKLDALLDEPMVEAYRKACMAGKLDSEESKVEMQTLSDTNNLAEWVLHVTKHGGLAIKAHLQSFHMDDWSGRILLAGLLVGHEDLAWVRLHNGSILPRQLLGEVGLTWDDVDVYYGLSAGDTFRKRFADIGNRWKGTLDLGLQSMRNL